jgi:nicotinamide phosphoribosyltransferase
MKKAINPFLATDSYKVHHHLMYPKNTTLVYSNFTPRSNKHFPEVDQVVVFGAQMMVRELHDMFEQGFFSQPKATVLEEIKREYSIHTGGDYNTDHIEALHDLGYLPIKVKSLIEGSLADFGIPVLTIYNTLPEFFWITNFLETPISTLLWKPMVSATIAREYRKVLEKWAIKTDEYNIGFVDFQGHDFSARGMDSIWAVISSGLGHAITFSGSDSLPVIHGARELYDETEPVIFSVPATEHSVMSAGTGLYGEFETFEQLLKDFPTGVLSVVSDTFDLWKVLTEYLPKMKEQIMARDGKLVIRPDSGDPADIICGTIIHNNKKEFFQYTEVNYDEPASSEEKGVIELLWDEFGGTINEQGYKVLDSHVGAIYGDSITLARAEDICRRLADKGFASTNIVFGIGSYTYQHNTRDSIGAAMKATYIEVCNPGDNTDYCIGNCKDGCNPLGINIFKDPITDDGVKKSAKGLLTVQENEANGDFELVQQVTWAYEGTGSLQSIYSDGNFNNPTTISEIRKILNN